MRGLTTALVVAGVALVGVLAVADAFRDRESAATAPSATTATAVPPPTLAETLRREDIRGVLLYSDEHCTVHSLVLPEMVDEVFENNRCRFDGRDGWIHDEGARLSPNARAIAQCRGRHIVVRDAQTGSVERRIDGCAPAWRLPFGSRLTWARGDAVYERGRPLLARDDLARALRRRHPNLSHLAPRAQMRLRIVDLAWLDEDRLIVSLDVRLSYAGGPFPVTVLFERKRVIAFATGLLRDWFVSSTGSFAAASGGVLISAGGDVIDEPSGLGPGRAAAFSPDERWLAYVTGRSIYLIGTPLNDEPGRVIRLPIAAQDLTWERINQETRVAGLGTG